MPGCTPAAATMADSVGTSSSQKGAPITAEHRSTEPGHPPSAERLETHSMGPQTESRATPQIKTPVPTMVSLYSYHFVPFLFMLTLYIHG